MNEYLESRKLKCLDGLHYSFEIMKLNYIDLYDRCIQIQENQENIIRVLSQCWLIVDMIHRVREISQSIPSLNKKNNELQEFIFQTKSIEDCRHYIQHLREELSKSPPSLFPVWGSLSWVDPNDSSNCFIAVFGAINKGINYSSCVYDNLEKRWVSKVTLGVENLSLNFDPLYESAIKFKDFIIPWLIENSSVNLKIKKEIPIFSVKFIV
ncbi:MAG: hypothetical protein JNK81_12795 [Anaerolineales bacterium]|nr:hypothetical protein [Anaerolineales bacterium]